MNSADKVAGWVATTIVGGIVAVAAILVFGLNLCARPELYTVHVDDRTIACKADRSVLECEGLNVDVDVLGGHTSED